MTDTVASPAPVAAASPTAKKTAVKKKAAVKGTKPAAAHPATSVMVTAAIKELKEKKGSSLPAIKKYLAANYKVDPAKLAPFIRKFLKAAVANKTIVQTKGSGASGHFKLAVAEAKPKKTAAKKAPAAKKAKAPGTPKKKKPAVKKVKPATGEPAAKKAKKVAATKAAKPKSPSKVKKPASGKPKAAKPKKPTVKKTVVAPKKK